MFHIFNKSRSDHLKEEGEHILDKVITPIALIAPLMTIPQVLGVWVDGNIKGVSIATWLGYALGSGLWVIYGLIHKEKPLTLANFFLFVFDVSIVIGVLFHR